MSSCTEAHYGAIDKRFTELQHGIFSIAYDVLRMERTRSNNHYLTKNIVTNTATETEELAAKIGKRLKGGEVIEMVSDLGGGKTTFVRGLAKGAGSKDNVSSPTFKICNVYVAGSRQIYHYDFYRLPEAGLIEHELIEGLTASNSIIVIEWGDVVKHVLPERRLSILITATGETSRKIQFSYGKDLSYLTEGIC